MNRIKLNDNVSPYKKRLRLMELSGIPLTENQKKKLKPRTESVSMVSPQKYHDRMKQQTSTLKSLEDDFDEVDLDEILKEMGYEESEEIDLTNLSKSELKDLVRNEVRNYFDENFEDPKELDFNEIFENLTK
jgi:hypothetical protein